MDRNEAFAIPAAQFHPILVSLNTTTSKDDGSFYWHLHLHEDNVGKLYLTLPKQKDVFSLAPFSLPI
jgi:hypothetical protein